jgi:hypothetical protein
VAPGVSGLWHASDSDSTGSVLGSPYALQQVDVGMLRSARILAGRPISALANTGGRAGQIAWFNCLRGALTPQWPPKRCREQDPEQRELSVATIVSAHYGK